MTQHTDGREHITDSHVSGGVVRWVFVLSLLAMALIAPVFAAEMADSHIQRLAEETGGTLRVSHHDRTGKVRFLRTEDGRPLPHRELLPTVSTPEEGARAFLRERGALFGLKDQSRELNVERMKSTERLHSFTRFQQIHDNVPVIAGEVIVQTDAHHNVLGAIGKISPDPHIDTIPTVAADAARAHALELVAELYDVVQSELSVPAPELWIYNPALLGAGSDGNILVWRMHVRAAGLVPVSEFVLVDAHTGAIALHFNQIKEAKNRIVFDNQNNPYAGLPGAGPVRTEGQGSSGIADADDAYVFAGDTYDFYFSAHGRDSLNNRGMALMSTVRYCAPRGTCPYRNAFWNGQQMVYGQGYASADDVVAHELTHGVTDLESGLYYYMQAGAINESLSDIWGEFVDLTNGRGNDSQAVRWLVGEDLSGGALRSMSDPPLYQQPDKMTSPLYACGEADQGGVHTNSGVNNKAVSLMVDGGSFTGRTVSGLGITKVAKIYYEAQTNLLTSGSDYADLYDVLQLACRNLVGTSGIGVVDCEQVKNALDAVEMNQQPPACPSPDAPVCTVGSGAMTIFSEGFESGDGEWVYGEIVNGTSPHVPLWALTDSYAHTGQRSLHGLDADSRTDAHMRTRNPMLIPAGAFMDFVHAFDFEDPYDGGVLEHSADGGVTWNDAKTLFVDNGYNGTVSSSFSNPLKGRSAFVGKSDGFITSRLNLNSLAGQTVLFRFRIGTDISVGSLGWFIDDVNVYLCTATPNGSWNSVPGQSPSHAVLAHGDGRFLMAVRGFDNELWVSTFDSSGSFNHDWKPIPGQTPSTPALAYSTSTQKFLMAVRGFNNELWVSTCDSSGGFNHDWKSIPGQTPSSPALAYVGASSSSLTTSRYHLVVRGADDKLWAARLDEAGTFADRWEQIPGLTPSSPALAFTPVGQRLTLVVRGADHKLRSFTSVIP